MIRRVTLLDLLAIDVPLVQAPMAGSNDSRLVIAVSKAGGLGSLPCAMLTPDRIRAEVEAVRAGTDRPFNLSFLRLRRDPLGAVAGDRRLARLPRYYAVLGAEPPSGLTPGRAPCGEGVCAVVGQLRPPVVSFHFGLPPEPRVDRVRATGAMVLSSATTVAEARWLVERGCDAIIA